jgi:hypothetical protein
MVETMATITVVSVAVHQAEVLNNDSLLLEGEDEKGPAVVIRGSGHVDQCKSLGKQLVLLLATVFHGAICKHTKWYCSANAAYKKITNY